MILQNMLTVKGSTKSTFQTNFLFTYCSKFMSSQQLLQHICITHKCKIEEVQESYNNQQIHLTTTVSFSYLGYCSQIGCTRKTFSKKEDQKANKGHQSVVLPNVLVKALVLIP